MTCAHVVAAATPGVYDNAPDRPEGVLSLDFLSAKNKMLTAKVVVWYPVNPAIPYEDIAGLQLLDEPPQGVKPLHLAGVETYWEHPFASFGFPRKKKAGRWARGILLGEVDDGRWIQIEDEKAQGYAIEEGFSGAPVLDQQEQKCVGMVVARDTKNDEAKIGFMIPGRILKPALNHIERLSLGDALHCESESVSLSELGAAYQFCRPDGWQPQSPLQTLEEQLADVQLMKPGADGVAKLYQFVAYLINPKQGIPRTIQKQLRSWIESRVEDVPVLLDNVAQRAEVWLEHRETDSQPHLLVWVRAQRDQRGLYEVKALFIPNAETYDKASGEVSHRLTAPSKFGNAGEKVRAQDLPGLVAACVDEVAGLYAQSVDTLSVDMLLPRSLLHQPVDSWTGSFSVQDNAPKAGNDSGEDGLRDDGWDADDGWGTPPAVPLGSDYQVVVRSAERLDPSYGRYQKLWEKKWNALLNQAQTQAKKAIISGEGVSWKKLHGEFKKTHVLGLKFVKGPPSLGRNSAFSTLFWAGVPTALWVREALEPDCNGSVNGVLECALCQLPATVQQQRMDAFAQEDGGDCQMDDSDDSEQNGHGQDGYGQDTHGQDGYGQDGQGQLEETQHIGHHLSLLWENPNLVFPTLSTQENPLAHE